MFLAGTSIAAAQTIPQAGRLASGAAPVDIRTIVAGPSIRSFIGLAENSWDFTAPDGVPGFGALNETDVMRLLAGRQAQARVE
jgi:hypothetical protein